MVPGRREIGPAPLPRSLEPVIPFDEVSYSSPCFRDYGSRRIKLHGDCLRWNIALMDAGVPIKAPVAGIAIGLVTDKSRWKVLTDIAGEDHLGMIWF